MEHIVLDTNCLVLCLPEKSAYHKVWLSFLKGTYKLCVSNEIMEEYAEIVGRFWGKDIADYVMKVIIGSSNTHFFTPYFKFGLITTDPDDNKFVDCAIAANAHFIVTEDKHFEVLKEIDFPQVDVIGIDAFVEQLNKLPTASK